MNDRMNTEVFLFCQKVITWICQKLCEVYCIKNYIGSYLQWLLLVIYKFASNQNYHSEKLNFWEVGELPDDSGNTGYISLTVSSITLVFFIRWWSSIRWSILGDTFIDVWFKDWKIGDL